MNKIIRCLNILLILALLGLPAFFVSEPAAAMGGTTGTAVFEYKYSYYFTTPASTDIPVSHAVAGTPFLGYGVITNMPYSTDYNNPPWKRTTKYHLYSFDLTALSISVASAANITFTYTGTGTADSGTVALYLPYNIDDGLMYLGGTTISSSNFGTKISNDVTTPGKSASPVVFTLTAAGVAEINRCAALGSKHVRFFMVDSNGFLTTGNQNLIFGWAQGGETFTSTASNPALNITYTAANSYVRSGTPTANGSASTQVNTGSVTAITWMTPRNCFNNDQFIEFKVTSSTNYLGLSLQLLDVNGNVLQTTTDQIRNNGIFYFITTIPNNYVGYLRCVETSHGGVKSHWGYSAAPIDASVPTNSTMVNKTNYPQTKNDWTNYDVTAQNAVFTVYWNTDMTVGDQSNTIFRIYYDGVNYNSNPANTVYSNQFVNLAGSGYQEVDSTFQSWLSKGYMLFDFYKSTGFDNRDSLVNDLNLSPAVSTWGFYQPVIYNVTGAAELTNTLSCAWYTQAGTTGLRINVPGGLNKVDPDAKVTMNLNASADTGILTALNACTLQLYQPDGTAFGSTGVYTISTTANQYVYAVGAVPGSWYQRTSLTKAGCSFTYIYDMPFNIGVSGANGGGANGQTPDTYDVLKGLMAIVKEHGLDNSMGHWLIIIVAMILSCLASIFFLRDPLRKPMAVVFPMLVFGAGLLGGWVDLWIVIILAVMIGWISFKVMTRAH